MPDISLGILRELLEWRLAPDRWQAVEAVVGRLAAARAAGDETAFRRAAGELALSGPGRVTRIGTVPAIPAPPRVRERVNHLIHSLTDGTPGPEPAVTPDADRPGAAAERSGDRRDHDR